AFIAVCLILPIHLIKGREFPNAEYDAADNTRKTLAQIFGGAAVILTFAWTFFKDSETLTQAWQQIGTQEFISSAELLSENNTVATRAAGIYALGRVAEVREEYHMSVRDTLVAFLTDATSLSNKEQLDRPERIKADVQAVIEVIGRRNINHDNKDRSLVLDHQYLIGANFFGLHGFQGASFYGVKGSGANFREVNLDGSHFDGADLSDYSGYGLKWQDNIASWADWEWDKYRYIVNFAGASLKKATFTKARLCGAIFSDADISDVNFSGADLSRVDFRKSKNIQHAKFEDKTNGKACAQVQPKFDEGSTIVLDRCKP
ncbi:MAG TPA: pentapeptide repeat-containing protein, partial [Methylobacter sp.]